MAVRKQDAKVHATAGTDISLCHFYQSWDQKEAGGAGEQGSRGRSILVGLLNYGQSSGFDMT